MAHYGILRDTQFADATEDIRGSHLYGLDDEKLGKIDDVIFDHSSGVIRYIVVDTGGWLSTKRFIVPADRLRASAKHNDDFEVPLDKQQVENFPPYQDSDLDSESKWEVTKTVIAPVGNGSSHASRGNRSQFTPTTSQIPGNSPSAAAAAESTDGLRDRGNAQCIYIRVGRY